MSYLSPQKIIPDNFASAEFDPRERDPFVRFDLLLSAQAYGTFKNGLNRLLHDEIEGLATPQLKYNQLCNTIQIYFNIPYEYCLQGILYLLYQHTLQIYLIYHWV